MNRSAETTRRSYLGAAMALTLFLAGCSANDDESTATTASATTTESSTATTAAEPTTSAPPETEPSSTTTVDPSERPRQVVMIDEAGVLDPDASWIKQSETFFVWGVESDDVLNVRSGPGINNPIIATVAPDSGGLEIFDVIERVGSSNWVAVELTPEGGVGWVANQFLRPQAPPGSPVVTGSTTPEIMALVEETISALGSAESIAPLVGSEGLTIAPFTFVGEETLTLSSSEILNDSAAERTWGFETGTGDPINMSLDQYLKGLEGRTALTSTAEIGYDEFIGAGNTINNLREVFADAIIVEYHHPGTEFYGGLDWTSVRFVFVDDGGQPVLRALVSDQWEI